MPGMMNRFTIYDAMERKGLFAGNTANADARDIQTGRSTFTGPVPYPKMLYHPKGEERKITPNGAQGPARYEMISRLVTNEQEHKAAVAAGWHEHPADAIAARNECLPEDARQPVPPKGAQSVLNAKNAEIEKLQKELAALRKMQAEGKLAGEEEEEPEV